MSDTFVSHNIIITEPSRNLRALGRNALSGKWKAAVLAVALSIVILKVPAAIFDNVLGINVVSMMTESGYTYNMDVEAYSEFYNNMPQFCPLSALYTALVTGAMSLGVTMFFMAVFRGHRAKISDIFLGFEYYGKVMGLFLFTSLFIFLWSLLFVVPGVIASIRYSQVYFILADDPSKGIRECVDESKAIMRGNCVKYFCMQFSFIGWYLLTSLVSGALQSAASVVVSGQAASVLLIVLGGIVAAPVSAYVYSTCVGFYEILSGHLIKETDPQPVSCQGGNHGREV